MGGVGVQEVSAVEEASYPVMQGGWPSRSAHRCHDEIRMILTL